MGTLPEEDLPLLAEVVSLPVPARATKLAAIIAAANPEITKYFRIEKMDVCRLDAPKAAHGFNVRCFEPMS